MSGVKCMQLLDTNMPIDETSIFTYLAFSTTFFSTSFLVSAPQTPSQSKFLDQNSIWPSEISQGAFYIYIYSQQGSLCPGGHLAFHGLRSKSLWEYQTTWRSLVFLIEKEEQGSFFTYVDSYQTLLPMLEVLQVQLPDEYEWNPFHGSNESVWTHNLEGVEAFAEPKSVCLLADIDLPWITCDHPPHFCASSDRQR